ncbi:MAG TPA: sugar dehydrogenase complex small subunit, partial [Methyloceanibacter sp.]|nr:sugar dehydrogenase complex small subunit [Methyloceanibacter sp.]
MPNISRRGLILGSASAATLALAFPRPACARGAITVEQFRALSARLTVLSMGRGADIARLAAAPGASAGPLATEIVAAWYSGNYRTATGLTSIGLPNALLWDALDFTKPPGFCGGATGYWADAPRA